MSHPTSDHQPVLLAEAIDLLNVHLHQWYLDCTFGGGGHTQAILERGGHVLALDFDQVAIAAGQDRFANEINQGQLILVRENFAELQRVWHDHIQQTHQERPNGILFDFGTSVMQLTDISRGFSFTGDGPLDMRMDERLGVTAADLLGALPEKQLANLFFEYGGEPRSKQIAHAIKTAPSSPKTVKELVTIIDRVGTRRTSTLHPATKVFQALRIAVNLEIDSLEAALPKAFTLLAPGGRLVTIAFHEGEDRAAKHLMLSVERNKNGIILTKHVVVPSGEEVARNPRSRSAKLRAVEKKVV